MDDSAPSSGASSWIAHLPVLLQALLITAVCLLPLLELNFLFLNISVLEPEYALVYIAAAASIWLVSLIVVLRRTQTKKRFPAPPAATPKSDLKSFGDDDAAPKSSGRFRRAAVVGYSFRFPGDVCSPEAFLELLLAKRVVTEPIPASKWSTHRFAAKASEIGRFCLAKVGLVASSDQFDPAFFSISAQDAYGMDNQQRVFLMCAIEALNRAGIPHESLRGSNTGVYVGTSVMEYLAANMGSPAALHAHTNPGLALCVIANRVSFFLGLRGPSMAVDTACASSITALDLATKAIEAGECEIAIVGGTNNLLLPDLTVGYTQMGVTAADGCSKSFDARANGYARAEGYGCVVLRAEQHARRANNPVRALVAACRSNANGDLTAGLTKPSTEAQKVLIEQTWAVAGIPLEAVTYVEAHGTGTAVGDPLEATAIGQTFGLAAKADGRPPVPISSVKSTLGHMEPAAGMASIVKACLMIENRLLFPQANFEVPHPDVNWSALHIAVPQAAVKVPAHERMAIAINGFGFGGSNSHAILVQPDFFADEDAALPLSDSVSEVTSSDDASLQHPAQSTVAWTFGGVSGAPQGSSGPAQVLLPVSADSGAALESLLEAWACYKNASNDARAVAAYAAVSRSHLVHRALVVANGPQSFRVAAAGTSTVPGFTQGALIRGKVSARNPAVVLIFAGQGTQDFDMGRDMYRTYPLFQETVDECDRLYNVCAGHSFLNHTGLFRGDACVDGLDINRPDVAQPAICFFQIAYARLLKSWGLQVTACLGHSVGEVASAHLAGLLTLKTTIRLIYTRGRLQQLTEGDGGMLAVLASAERTREILAARGYAATIELAAINSSNSITLAGPKAQILELKEILKHQYGMKSVVLQVNCAFHSSQMEPINGKLHHELRFLVPAADSSARVGVFASSALGCVPERPASKVASPSYWWDNVRGAVHFQAAVAGLCEALAGEHLICVEIAYRSALVGITRQCLQDAGREGTCLASCDRSVAGSLQVGHLLGSLYTNGVDLDWLAINNVHSAPPVDVPVYQFRTDNFSRIAPHVDRYRKGLDRDPFLRANGYVSLGNCPWAGDHRVAGNPIMPATGFIEFFLETMQLPSATYAAHLAQIEFREALPLDTHEEAHLHVVSGDHGEYRLQHADEPILGEGRFRATNNNRIIARCTRRDFDAHRAAASLEAFDFFGYQTSWSSLDNALRGAGGRRVRHLNHDAFYKLCRDMGYEFGSAHANIQDLYLGDEEAMYVVDCSRYPDGEGFRVHPAILDACIHGGLSLLQTWSTTFVPVSVEHLTIYRCLDTTAERVCCQAVVVERGPELISVDVLLVPLVGDHLQQDAPLALFRGLTMKPLSSQLQAAAASDLDIFLTMRHQSKLPPVTWNVGALHHAYTAEPEAEDLRTQYIALTREIPKLQRYIGLHAAHACQRFAGQEASLTSEAARYLSSLQRLAQFASADDQPADPRYVIKTGQALMTELRQVLPFCAAELRTTEVLCHELPDFVLYPERVGDVIYADDALVSFFRSSLTVRPVYRALARTVKAACEQLFAREPTRVIRILEVGTRHGGLTREINELLQDMGTAGLIEYHASDIAGTFLHHASAYVTDMPWVTTRRFDIEKDAATQGLEPQSYDIVVVLSTLHGVVDIDVAMEQVKRMVTPNGLLINTEPSNPDLWWFMEAWFGGMEVWWRFNDFRKTPATYRAYCEYANCWMAQERWVELFERQWELGEVYDLAGGATPWLFNTLFTVKQSPDTLRVPTDISRVANADQVFVGFADASSTLATTLCEGSGGARPIACPIHQLEAELRQVLLASTEPALEQPVRRLRRTDGEVAAHVKCAVVLDLQNASVRDVEVLRVLYLELLDLVKLLATLPDQNFSPSLFAVTRGVHEDNFLLGYVAGLWRAINDELPRLTPVVVDVSATAGVKGERAVLDVLHGVYGYESEFVIDPKGEVTVPRLHRLPAHSVDLTVPTTNCRRLVIEKDIKANLHGARLCGVLHGGSPKEASNDGPASLRIRVERAALNFKDVMLTAGLLDKLKDGQQAQLGFGCIGRLFDGSNQGQRVVALAENCLATYVQCPTDLMLPIPSTLSSTAVDALACITLYGTAHLALVQRARLSQDDVLLIHSATSGVGQCALQLAQHVGCRVIATAGSVEKRRWLQENFNCLAVTDSRDATRMFRDIMVATQQTGVSVVLSSAAGDVRQALLETCAPAARFVDIAKADMLNNAHTHMGDLLQNVSYISCQLDLLAHRHPHVIKDLLADVVAYFERGVYGPIQTEEFELANLPLALKSAGKTFRKAVFVMDDAAEARLPSTVALSAVEQYDPEGVYIVTGGLGGVGLWVAHMLARHGARHLVLVSRNANQPSRYQQHLLASLAALGAELHLVSCDVTDRDRVERMVVEARRHGPLRGVIHLAARLADGVLMTQHRKTFLQGVESKAFGLWHLHETTLTDQLDFFIVTTSTQDLSGLEQGNYVAGNLVATRLAQMRERQGLPATVVALGPVIGAGMVENDPTVARILQARGAGFVHVAEVAEVLRLATVRGLTRLPPYVMATRINNFLCNDSVPLAPGNLRWSHFKGTLKQTSGSADLTPAERLEKAREKVAQIFCTSPEEIDVKRPLIQLGVDSLVGTELLHYLHYQLGVTATFTDIVSGASLSSLLPVDEA